MGDGSGGEQRDVIATWSLVGRYGVEGSRLDVVRVLAEELEVVGRDDVDGEALDRGDLAQVGLHRGEVGLRLLQVDVLQPHVPAAAAVGLSDLHHG